MSKEKVGTIGSELEGYINSQERVEPLPYLYGELTLDSDLLKMVKDLSISSRNGLEELNKIISRFAQKVENYVEGEQEFKDIENDNGNNGVFFKIANNEDLTKLNNLSVNDGENVDYYDYLKGKYKNNFFVVEINLDDSGNKKIILFRALTPTFYAKKSKFIISPFSSRRKIDFVDNKKTLILDENFDIAAFINSQGESFFFITNRKRFEDLFDYREKYDDAYTTLTTNLNFVQWSEEEPSLHTKRTCYSIANFSRLDECVTLVKERLSSNEDNSTKKALKSKGINFSVDNGELMVFPQGTRETLALLKIMKDGVAKTDLLRRNVLGGDFEELE